jgi:hypothetical protein
LRVLINPHSLDGTVFCGSTSMTWRSGQIRPTTTAEVRLDQGKAASFSAARPSVSPFWLPTGRNFLAAGLDQADSHAQRLRYPENVGLTCIKVVSPNQEHASPDRTRIPVDADQDALVMLSDNLPIGGTAFQCETDDIAGCQSIRSTRR